MNTKLLTLLGLLLVLTSAANAGIVRHVVKPVFNHTVAPVGRHVVKPAATHIVHGVRKVVY